MTKQKKHEAAPQEPEIKDPAAADDKGNLTFADVADKITLAGEPLPIDPDTGEIDVGKLTDEQRADLEAASKQIAEAVDKILPKVAPGVKAVKDNTARIIQTIQQNSDGMNNLHSALNTLSSALFTDKMRDVLQGIRDSLQPIQDLISEIDALEPFIKAELKKDEYGGLTFDALMDYTPGELLELRRDPGSLIYKVFEAAKEARAAEIPVIDVSRADRLKAPTDRFNFLAFNDFKETGGQIAFNMMAERDKRDPERSQLNITMRYSLTFGEDPDIKTTRELNHFDRRLQQAIDSLYTPGGQNIFLIGDISETMGGSRNPSNNRRDKINSSLTKQGTARIYINNAKEAAEYDYPEIEYDGIILDFERIRVKHSDNGQEATAIKVNSRPVMMEFADKRKQMSVVPIEVIQSGINQTDNSLRIEDYLLYRIIRQKNTISKLQEQQSKKYTQNRQKQIREASHLIIILDTFHEQIGAAGKKKKDRDRADKTAGKYLDHYKDTGYITNYKIDSTRIKIDLPI